LVSPNTGPTPISIASNMIGIGFYSPYSDNGTDKPYYTTSVNET